MNRRLWKWVRRLIRWSTNPLALAVLGFLLTGILGTYFTHILNSGAKQREQETASRARAFEAVREISDLLYERRVRSVMYASALEHGARATEVTAAKKAYEDAFARWNTKLQSNTFRIREMTGNVGHQERSPIEGMFLTYLQPLLNGANNCIYSAFLASVSDSGEGAANAKKTLEGCGTDPVKIDRIHDAISKCGYVFVNALYTSIQPSDELRAKAEQIAAGMARACRLTGVGPKRDLHKS